MSGIKESSGKCETTSGLEGLDVVEPKHNEINISFNLLCENPLIYVSKPLFVLNRNIHNNTNKQYSARNLLDSGATTDYVSTKFINKNKIPVETFNDRQIQIKVGDNNIITTILVLADLSIILERDFVYSFKAVVYDIPDEYDCILGMPFFELINPDIDWKLKTLKRRNDSTPWGNDSTPRKNDSIPKVHVSENHGLVADEEQQATLPNEKLTIPIEEDSPVYGSKLHRAARDDDTLEAISGDSCRTAVSETDVKEKQADQESNVSRNDSIVSIEEGRRKLYERVRKRKENNIERMYTMGIQEADGTTTKFIKKKQFQKLMKKTSKISQDILLILTNEMIKKVQEDIKRNDEPDNVGSQKSQRFLDTNWETFKNNPAYPVLLKYKDTVFKPELPDGLPLE